MKNSHKFFENRSCKYYPCHKGLKVLNCLFCFCPLHDFCQDYHYEGKKCEECLFPHEVRNYTRIIKKIKEYGN